jgi:hypothetical protein
MPVGRSFYTTVVGTARAYDSSADIATDYGPNCRGIGVSALVRAIFSSVHVVQTGSGKHPALCPMASGVGQSRPEANRSLSFSAKAENGGVVPPFPTSFHGWCLIKH